MFGKKAQRAIATFMMLLMVVGQTPVSAFATDSTEGITATSADSQAHVRKRRSILPNENTHTYSFYRNKDKSELLDKQILRNGQTLQRIEIPKAEREVFDYWARVDNDERFDFTDQPEQVSSEQNIELYAKFLPGALVHYFRKGEDNNGYILHTTDLIPIGQKATSLWADALLGQKKVFDYWSETEDGQPFDFNKPLSGDINLYAVYTTGVVLTPDPTGGTASVPVKATNRDTWKDVKGKIVSVTKKGYDFSHWSLSEKGPVISDDQKFDDNATLYAVWTPRHDTPYTVVNYLENPNDDGYSLASSVVYQGTTDSPADLHLSEQKSSIDAQYARDADGYLISAGLTEYLLEERADYDDKRTPENVTKTIRGDGTTVYTLYWKRKKFNAQISYPGQDAAINPFYARLAELAPDHEDYVPTLDPESPNFDAESYFGGNTVDLGKDEVLAANDDPDKEGYNPEDIERALEYMKYLNDEGNIVMSFKWGQNIDPVFRPMLDYYEVWYDGAGEGYSAIHKDDLIAYGHLLPDPLEPSDLPIRDFGWTYRYNARGETITSVSYMPFMKDGDADNKIYKIEARAPGDNNRLIYRFIEVSQAEAQEAKANPSAVSSVYARLDKGRAIAKDALTTAAHTLGITQVDIANIKGFTALDVKSQAPLKEVITRDSSEIGTKWDLSDHHFDFDTRLSSKERLDKIQYNANSLGIYPLLYTRNSYVIKWQTNDDNKAIKTSDPYLYESKYKDLFPMNDTKDVYPVEDPEQPKKDPIKQPKEALEGYVVDETTRDSDGYVFRGWYQNPGLTLPVDFENGFIDAKDTIFYGKWTPPYVRVTFHRTGFQGDDPQDKEYGVSFSEQYQKYTHIPETIQENIRQNPDNFSNKPIEPDGTKVDFRHWYYVKNGQRLIFDLNQELDQDYDLYPVWAADFCDITFLPADSDDHAFTQRVDRDSWYRLLTYDRYRILKPDAPEIPEGKIFIGWKEITQAEEGGGLFQEQQNERVRYSRKFRAVLRDKDPLIHFIYHPNGAPLNADGTAAADITTQNVLNNQRFKAIENPYIYEGKTFLGWNLKADGSSTHYLPGEPFLVDKDKPTENNHLYAIWGSILVKKSVLKVTDSNDVAYPENRAREVGDKIYYHLKVTNPNAFNMPSFSYKDELLKISDTTVNQQLAANGGFYELDVPVPYVVTPADLKSGVVNNTIKVTGNTPYKSTIPGEDDESVPAKPKPKPRDISVEKTASRVEDAQGQEREDKKIHAVGDKIYYSFTFTNTGEATIESYVLRDAKLPGAQEITIDDHPLAPTKSYKYEHETPHVVTQADLDNGSFYNKVFAEIPESPVPEGEEPPSDDESVPVEPNNSFKVEKNTVKVTNGDGTETRKDNMFTTAGDRIYYSFTVTNTGNQTIKKLKFKDTLIDLTREISLDLKPGFKWTYTPNKFYEVTQADINTGKVNNTVSVVAVPPSGNDTPPEESTNTTPPVQTPKIVVEKTATEVTDAQGKAYEDGKIHAAGDLITYKFTVTNKGNVTIRYLKIDDSTIKFTKEFYDLNIDPDGKFTYTLEEPYKVSQADLNNGEVLNTAIVGGKTPGGDVPDTPSNKSVVPVEPNNSFKVEKNTVKVTDSTGNELRDENMYTTPGDRIYYSFTVTNTGNQTIKKLKIKDDRIKLNREIEMDLNPGTSWTYKPNLYYTVTQADIDQGKVDNTVTVVATPPSGNDTPPEKTTNTTPPLQTPKIEVEKQLTEVTSADGTPYEDGKIHAKGDLISYKFIITNKGNVTVRYVKIDDDRIGLVKELYETIAPGKSISYETEEPYVVTQRDLNEGGVLNTATVGGKTPGGDIPPVPSNPVNVPVEPDNSFKVIKNTVKVTDSTGDETRKDKTFIAVNDRIYYSFTIINTGNQTIKKLKIKDDRIKLNREIEMDLNPGASWVYKPNLFYSVTQADLNQGKLDNTVNVVAVPPSGIDTPPEESTNTTPPTQTPQIEVQKEATSITSADRTPYEDNKIHAAGDLITYKFTITNTGNVDVVYLLLNDENLRIKNKEIYTKLAPGDVYEYITDPPYEVTQDDMDNGSVSNIVTVGGKTPGGDLPPTPSNESVVPVEPNNSFKVEKKTAKVTDKTGLEIREDLMFKAAEDRIYYSFTITNTGNQTIKKLKIKDDRINLDRELSVNLKPGFKWTYSPSLYYKVTQEDLNQGKVDNTVTVVATPPSGNDTPPEESTNTTPPLQTPEIKVVKNATKVLNKDDQAYDDVRFYEVGDKIYYSFTIINTGNVNVRYLKLNDSNLGISNKEFSVNLAPGEKFFYEEPKPYIVTPNDLELGQVLNTAKVGGKTPGGDIPETPSNDNVVPGKPNNSFKVVKNTVKVTDKDGTQERDDMKFIAVGDRIYYSFTVTNTGNQTIKKLRFTDKLLKFDREVKQELKPGATWTYKPNVYYTVTQADLNQGKVDNTVSVVATPPSGNNTPPEESTNTTPPIQTPSITVEKKTAQVTNASGVAYPDNKFHAVGDKIFYSFIITNTGNVSVRYLKIADPKISLERELYKEIKPGEQYTHEEKEVFYTVTEEDLKAGSVSNTATVSGKTPGGDIPETPSNENIVPGEPTPTPPDPDKPGIPVPGLPSKEYYYYLPKTSDTGKTSLAASLAMGGMALIAAAFIARRKRKEGSR